MTMNAQNTNLLLHLKSQWEKYLTKKEILKILKACNIDIQQALEIKSRQIINTKEFTAKVSVKTHCDDNRIEDTAVQMPGYGLSSKKEMLRVSVSLLTTTIIVASRHI
jgi:hypothetical protein